MAPRAFRYLAVAVALGVVFGLLFLGPQNAPKAQNAQKGEKAQKAQQEESNATEFHLDRFHCSFLFVSLVLKDGVFRYIDRQRKARAGTPAQVTHWQKRKHTVLTQWLVHRSPLVFSFFFSLCLSLLMFV